MARSIQTIFNQMQAEANRLATEANNETFIAMLNNSSRVAIWKILFYAVAYCTFLLEAIFDNFSLEIDDRIAKLKPSSARWYAEKAKDFQYGFPLVPESDFYDNSLLTQDQIDQSKIITHAAVVEQDRGIRIKVAKTVGSDLGPLAAGELAALQEYFAEIKPAGIKLNITSGNPDALKSTLRVYYNPLVLRADGGRIDGNDETPVQSAFKTYLENLPFNGLFIPQLMIDQLQKVPGVIIVKDDLWQARYGALDFNNIDVEYIPDAGYLRIADEDLIIEFIPHAVI
jgi:hypothetical protein